MKLTFLGTGTSFGVPQIGCLCDVCSSHDPRDRRGRVGALIETDTGTRLLVDTPPELRLQLVAARVREVDAVLYTHAHADHTNGIDDLRAFTVRRSAPMPVFGPPETLDVLARRFSYIFDETARPLPGTSRPEVRAQPLTAGKLVTIGDVQILPIAVPHGGNDVFAYRIGPVAYVTDAQSVPPHVVEALRGVRVLVLNALFHIRHPTHLSFPEAIVAAEAIGAERTYLTHLTHDNLHADLEEALPPGIMPAYDGLRISI